MRIRWVASLLVLALLFLSPSAASTQQGTPEGVSGPLDLAAMALAPEDLPAGYFDEYSDWFGPAEAFAALVIGGPAPAGLARAYQSFYVAPEIGGAVHVFLLEFASAAQATAGAAIVVALALSVPVTARSAAGPGRQPDEVVRVDPISARPVVFLSPSATVVRDEVDGFAVDEVITTSHSPSFVRRPAKQATKHGLPACEPAALRPAAVPSQVASALTMDLEDVGSANHTIM